MSSVSQGRFSYRVETRSGRSPKGRMCSIFGLETLLDVSGGVRPCTRYVRLGKGGSTETGGENDEKGTSLILGRLYGSRGAKSVSGWNVDNSKTDLT